LFFQANYDEIELQKISYDGHFSDVIVIMSPKNVTKITTQNFFILGLPQSKFLATQWMYPYCMV